MYSTICIVIICIIYNIYSIYERLILTERKNMTKEEIFALAEKADLYLASDDSIIKFANLIAEKEREECAKICDAYDNGRYSNAADLCAESIRARGQE